MNKLLTGMLALAISTQLLAKPIVDPALEARFLSKKDADITVIAKFKAQGPMNKRLQGKSPSEVLKQKKVIASISQKSLTDHISALRKKSSDIKKMVSLWINNSMIITAKSSFIKSLTERDDLERLDLDAEIKLFDPIVRSVEKGINSDDFTYGLKKVQAAKVWNELGINGTGVTVGVLDTGIDTEHETLVGRTLATKDFVSSYEDNAPNDGHGHGTHCSGTIGGTNAGGKHIGVAPGVNFIVGKIFGDSGSTSVAAIMNGMQWITDPDGDSETNDFPRVVSNSWGGPLNDRWQDIINTWRSIGIIPVFAAGNSGPRPGTIGAPGAYPEVLSIGATDSQDKVARFSSRGPVNYAGETYIKPDVAAPGVDVYSAKPGGGFQNMSGTSMATPHVAGVVALMLQADPEIDHERVSEILQETALELGDPGKDGSYGSGRVNAFDAVSLVLTGGKASVSVGSGDQVATIKVMPGNKTYQTNNGQAMISLPAGTYQFTISAFGYFSKTVDVEVVAGETAQVNTTLEQSPSFTVSFETRDGNGVAQSSNISFVGVPIEGGTTNGGTLEVSAPGGDYTVEVRTLGYQSTQVSFSVNANTHVFISLLPLPEYLIIDHDSGKPYESFYTAALDNAGVEYDIKESIGADEIAGYQKVVWFTGLNSSAGKIATPEEQAMLTEYVANGGRLIISGQDVGYALKSTSFYKEVIGAKFVKDKSDVKTVVAGEFSFELDGGDSANNQKWPDVVAVADGNENAEVLYTYQGQGPAIMSNTHGSGKVVYMAFGFEGINGESNRFAVMDNLLDAAAASASEVLDRMEWAYRSNPHAYKAMIRNFKVTDENRGEVETYLEGKANKAPFRTVLQSLMK